MTGNSEGKKLPAKTDFRNVNALTLSIALKGIRGNEDTVPLKASVS